MGFTLENSVRQDMNDAQVDTLDVGGGTAIMRICDAALVLSEHNLSNPAFGASVNGVATANAIAADAAANNTGTADNCKWYDRAGTLRFTGTVTATGGGGDIELNSTSITAGVQVSITAGGTITQLAA